MKFIAKCILFLKMPVKIAAACAVISGALTTILTNHPSMTGLTLIAAGIITYVAGKMLPLREYEKTTHIAPVAAKRIMYTDKV